MLSFLIFSRGSKGNIGKIKDDLRGIKVNEMTKICLILEAELEDRRSSLTCLKKQSIDIF